ncbi:hypothetical protein [Allocoleopsis sp.]|uniref:hypothetical protein n=1 Tax=Allocoleopsis sp. TaxID=3088169 RepID=UPI002FD5F47F
MFIKHFTIVSLALYLGLAVNFPGQAQEQSNSSSVSDKLENAFNPPPTGSLPVNRQGGATRGEQHSCEPLSSQELPPNKCLPEGFAPDKLTPEKLAPDNFAPKPLTSSPTDSTNW